MDRIPPEMLQEILRHVLYVPDTTEQLDDALHGPLNYRCCHLAHQSLSPRYATTLLTCSLWYELGLPFLLETIVVLHSCGSGRLSGLRSLLHRRPDLAVHLRRLIIFVHTADDATTLNDVLVSGGQSITEIDWFIPYDPGVPRGSTNALLDTGLRSICPKFALVSTTASFDDSTGPSILKMWTQSRLRKLLLQLYSDIESSWILDLQVPELHIKEVILSDWKDILHISENTGVRTIYLTAAGSNPDINPSEREALARCLDGSSENVKAMVRIV